MLNKIYQSVFFSSLILGTVIACSANSWFTCWLGLEINLMSLIPLLIIKLSPLTTETAIKYFLVQAMASLIIIFSSLMDSSYIISSLPNSTNIIIILALGMKMGMAPFHFWFPQVMKISDWAQCTMILTWQKIAPFILMSSIFNSILFSMLILTSVAVGSLGGLNQTSMKNILTYSSITHSAWMLAVCSISLYTWFVYFTIYSFISVSLIYMLYYSKMSFIYEVGLSKSNKMFKLIFFMTMFSLGGLPPFLGFLSKIMAIQIIMTKMSMFIVLSLILGSLISLYYYTRVVYFMMLMTSKTISIKQLTTKKSNIMLTSFIIMGNMMAPMIVSLI